MSSYVRAIAPRALALATAAALTLGTLPALAATSLDELIELDLRAWGGEAELLPQTFAPDGVHTATFYDRTNEYVGPDAIERVARFGMIEPVGPRIELPAADGEWRWVDFVTLAGGTACLSHAVDGLLVRQDCLVPENSTQSRARAGLAVDDHGAEIDAIVERLDAAWGPGTTVESLAAIYAPEAVHSARFPGRTNTYTGPDEIRSVAGTGTSIEPIGPRVVFETPPGELAWAQVNSLAGGSVCLFRAVDGMVTRHDCLVPSGT